MLRLLGHKLPFWLVVPHQLQLSIPHTATIRQLSLHTWKGLKAISFAPVQQQHVQQTLPNVSQSAAHGVASPDVSPQTPALCSEAQQQPQTAHMHTDLPPSCLGQPTGVPNISLQQQAQMALTHMHHAICCNPKAETPMTNRQQAWNRSICQPLRAKAALHSAATTQGIGKKGTGPVAVAISGGVDSAVAALLLKQAG